MTKITKSRFALLVAGMATTVLLFGSAVSATELPKDKPPDTEVSNNELDPESTITASDGRSLYTEEERPEFPVFNSLVGEEHFLSITDPNGKVIRSDAGTLELQLDQRYDVVIHYDNNALPKGIKSRGYANDVRVRVSLPLVYTSAAEEGEMTATISAHNTNPATVSDTILLSAHGLMEIEIVPDSAYIINQDPTNGDVISVNELLNNGVLIGSNNMIGIVLYGPEHAGQVVFSFRTVLPNSSSTVRQMQPTIKPDANHANEANLSTVTPDTVSQDTTLSNSLDAEIVIITLIGLVIIVLVFLYALYRCRKDAGS